MTATQTPQDAGGRPATAGRPKRSVAHFAGTCACGQHTFHPGDRTVVYPATRFSRARIYSCNTQDPTGGLPA